MSDLTVHPVADLFPMLAEDELAELAASIREHGLDHPIVLDPQGRILDGRNRLAACRIVGVEPRFKTYDGDDQNDYALRNGIKRRHLTTGARAMIAAKAARLEGHGGQKRIAEETGISFLRISDANVVLDWCDATVINDVIAGTRPLSKAVEEARRLKREDTERESKKARLRDDAPDLLARVGEGLDLDEAVAALGAREEKARQEMDARAREERERETIERDRRQRHTRSFAEALAALWSLLDPDPIAFAENTWESDANPHRTTPGAKDAFTAKGLALIADRLTALSDHVEESGGSL